MRRSLAVLCWILVGAFASGSAIGFFLYQSNRDRSDLAETARLAQEQVSEARDAQGRIALEANRKVAEASAQVERAQELLKQYEEERRLLLKAIPLNPDVRKLRNWSESVSYPLGVSLKLPPGSSAVQTDDALVAAKTKLYAAAPGTEQWLSISAYNAKTKQELTNRLTNQIPLVYLVNGRLLTGIRGTMADLPGYVYLLDSRQGVTSTHLIWAKASADITESKVLDALSTLAFRS